MSRLTLSFQPTKTALHNGSCENIDKKLMFLTEPNFISKQNYHVLKRNRLKKAQFGAAYRQYRSLKFLESLETIYFPYFHYRLP